MHLWGALIPGHLATSPNWGRAALTLSHSPLLTHLRTALSFVCSFYFPSSCSYLPHSHSPKHHPRHIASLDIIHNPDFSSRILPLTPRLWSWLSCFYPQVHVVFLNRAAESLSKVVLAKLASSARSPTSTTFNSKVTRLLLCLVDFISQRQRVKKNVRTDNPIFDSSNRKKVPGQLWTILVLTREVEGCSSCFHTARQILCLQFAHQTSSALTHHGIVHNPRQNFLSKGFEETMRRQ